MKDEDQDTQNSVHLTGMPDAHEIECDPNWPIAMELRGEVLKTIEEAKSSDGVSNPLDIGIVVNLEPEEFIKLKPFEPEMADLCGVSRFTLSEGEKQTISVQDLSTEPRCERSWPGKGTAPLKNAQTADSYLTATPRH